MANNPVDRRLAAILAADVVGYSRLMEANEESTLTSLRTLRRQLFDPAIARGRGRIFKTMGDGYLIEFGSVVDALKCAVEIQTGMPARYTDVPEDRRIIFRISLACYSLLHLGQALAHNMETLLVTRFLCGVFACAPLTISGGLIVDIWDPVNRGYATALFSAGVFVGPVLGPIAGGL